MSAIVVAENKVVDGVEIEGKVYTLKDIDKKFHEDLRFYMAQKKQAEEAEKSMKAIAIAVLKNYGLDHVDFDDGSIKLTEYETTSFDQAAFKKENPDLAARYMTKKSQTRVNVR